MTSVDCVKEAAAEGNAIAQFLLGKMYLLGVGIGQNDKKAAEFFRQAANQESALAQLLLGLMHESGAGGIEKSDEKAVELYQQAVKQGNADAQVQLGLMHETGRGGIEQSNEKAVELYQQAADQNNAAAHLYLGNMYFGGRGVGQSDEKAVELFQKAADQNNAEAQACLGLMYQNGSGVAQNFDEALKWSRKAYDNGFEATFTNYLVLDSLLKEDLPRDDCLVVIDYVRGLHKKVLEILHERHNVKNTLNADATLEVCHYTKYKNLKNMLKGADESHLRMYNVRYCNDPTEGNYFFGKMNPNSSLDYFAQERKSNIQLLENPLASTYILSLCNITNKDKAKQEIPNLWSVHGDGARGACLTFEIPTTSLSDPSTQEVSVAAIIAAKPTTQKTNDSSVTVYRILYGKKERDNTITALKKELKAIEDFIKDKEYKDVVVRLVWEVLGLLPYLYKDESYAYEDECRIIRNFIPDDKRLKTDDNDHLYWKTPLGLLREATIDDKKQNQCTIILGYGMGDNAGARDYIKNRLRHISKSRPASAIGCLFSSSLLSAPQRTTICFSQYQNVFKRIGIGFVGVCGFDKASCIFDLLLRAEFWIVCGV